MIVKKNRQVQTLRLTPNDIDSIHDKGVNLDEFNNWRYFITLQLKRVNHKMRLQNG